MNNITRENLIDIKYSTRATGDGWFSSALIIWEDKINGSSQEEGD